MKKRIMRQSAVWKLKPAIKTYSIALLLSLPIAAYGTICQAESDLDDQIFKYKDDPISEYDELGKGSPNVSFIVVEALSRSNVTNTDDKHINSVVVGPGSNVGDIYNVHLGNEDGSDCKKSDCKKKDDKNSKKDKKKPKQE